MASLVTADPPSEKCEIADSDFRNVCLTHGRALVCPADLERALEESESAIRDITIWLEKGQIMYAPEFFISEFHRILHEHEVLLTRRTEGPKTPSSEGA
jgi:hypothetical protein